MGHAYYDFQHVELTNVGSGKKRTQNPPGGPTSNIFGAEEASPSRPSGRPNKMASSLPFGDSVDSPPSSASSSPPPTPVKTVCPNPVTGQGYEATELSPKPSPQQGLPSTPRRRIPPGGFSSPLW